MNDNGYWEYEGHIGGVKINSAGHIFAKCGRRIDRPCGRNDFLLFYVASGSECFLLDGTEKDAEAGSILLFTPGEPQQHICRYEGVSEFYYVHFECDTDYLEKLLPIKSSVIHKCLSAASLVKIFQTIIDELQYKMPYYKEVSVAELHRLFFTVRRKIEAGDEQGDILHRKQIQKIIHEINISCHKPLTLDDYAAIFGLSKYHFSRIFKESTGLSPIAYRNKIRLRHAKERLEDTDDTVSYIAESTGFESVQYFCDAFKNEFGISPTECRKAARQKLQ